MPPTETQQLNLIADINRNPTLIEIETRLWRKGYKFVCGVDEVGRGPLAGPVVAAAVVLPPYMIIDGIADSKTLSPVKREELYQIIEQCALTMGLGAVSAAGIDRIGILPATHLAFHRAIRHLKIAPDHLLVDGYPIPYQGEQTALIKGDRISQTIAAASIIAKVTRDRLMMNLSDRYIAYGFAQHKGYGTLAHRNALKQHGPCPIHRLSFRGVIQPADESK
jgi:ribonuclease HII